MQIGLGLPEPWALSSLPRLKLVLNGIAHARVSNKHSPSNPGSPSQHLSFIRSSKSYQAALLLVTTSCYYGQPARYISSVFSKAGEITVPTRSAFQPSKHLACLFRAMYIVNYDTLRSLCSSYTNLYCNLIVYECHMLYEYCRLPCFTLVSLV